MPDLSITAVTKPTSWLNRNILGMGLTSFFSDLGHEMATAVLPPFLASIGVSPAALGAIEGVADAVSSFAKLGAGWYTDRIGRRKPLVVLGYSLTTAKALFALAITWPQVLVVRALAWLGRGIRSPLRDAILAESVPADARGRAFGFHRAGDTLGAIAGPLVALVLMGAGASYRTVFWITAVPGVLAALTFATLVQERRRLPNHTLRLWQTIGGLPTRFKLFLVGVGLFGIGDFAHTLLTLRAAQVLTPALGAGQAGTLAVSLYVLHNILYAGASYPVGVLADRFDKRGLLALGYLLAVVMNLALMSTVPSLANLGLIFVLGGTVLAIEDALEGAITADLLPEEVWGTGYGVLATVNGLGDFLSSLIVGALWAGVSPAVGFGYAAGLGLVGALIVYHLR
ncbi:MAG: MFS transporter [Chloroflexota bacterium]